MPGAFVMWFIFLMTGQDTSPHHPCVRLSLSPFLTAERPLLLPDHSKVGGKSKWPASSTVRPAVHTFHTAEPGVSIPVEMHGQTTNSSCRSNILHMNVNGCVDMPMVGPSGRAGQVRSGFQSPLSPVTVLTTAGGERGGWCECGGWLPYSIMDSTEARC